MQKMKTKREQAVYFLILSLILMIKRWLKDQKFIFHLSNNE